MFFRGADLGQSIYLLGRMFGGSATETLLETWQFGLAAFAIVLSVGGGTWEWFERAMRAPGRSTLRRWP